MLKRQAQRKAEVIPKDRHRERLRNPKRQIKAEKS
jgi:hypothetical protein